MNTSSKLDQPRPFGRFLLTHKIAAGGMATVWKAETRPGDPLHGRQLAIKILHNHLSDSDDFIRMFRDEGHLAKQLEHANVVRVFEIAETDGDHYLAMEYVEGRNVAQLINAARLNHTTLPAGVIFEVLRQVLTALAYVHGVKGRNGRPLGIVHRDISPQNILISKDLIVKVTDFGIARGKHRSDQTRTGTVKGKLHYMAPEQAAGQRVDHRADLYALGAVAFEMLTGQPVLGVDNTAVVQGRTIRGELDLSAKFRSQPEDVKAWLLKSLARLPDERFQSAEAMLGAMELLGKASRRYYKPEAMLQWLELDEARGSQQRRRELFFDDEAVASGRVQPGAVRVQGEGQEDARRRAVAGDVQRSVSRVHLSAADRDARLQRSVDWRVSDDAALDVPAAARTGQRRAIAAAPSVAQAASGQRGAVVAQPVRPHETATSAAVAPGSFGAPALAPAKEPAAPRSAPTPKPATRVTRVEAEYKQGLLMAQAVAACCAMFVLLAAALHVTETHLDLPPLREDMVASLWDETPARSDALARSAPQAASAAAKPAPRVVPVAPPQPQWRAPARDPVADQLQAWAADDPESVAAAPDDAVTAAAAAEELAPMPAEQLVRKLSDEELVERGWQAREIQTVARPGELDPAERAARRKREAAARASAAAPALKPAVPAKPVAVVHKTATASAASPAASGAKATVAPATKAPVLARSRHTAAASSQPTKGATGGKPLPGAKPAGPSKPNQVAKPGAVAKSMAPAKASVANKASGPAKAGAPAKVSAPAKASPAAKPNAAAKSPGQATRPAAARPGLAPAASKPNAVAPVRKAAQTPTKPAASAGKPAVRR